MCKVTLNSEHVQWHWCDDAPPEFYYEASLASLCAKLLLSHHYFVGTTITLPQLLAPFVTNSISIAFCVQLLRLLFCSMAQFHSHLDRITISLFSSLATEMNRTA